MRRGRLNDGLLSLALAVYVGACSAGTHAQTQVSRNQLVHTGRADYDAFFQELHQMQIALNEADHRRIDIVRDLAVGLSQPEHTSMLECVSLVRQWSLKLRTYHTQVEIVVPANEAEPSPDAPYERHVTGEPLAPDGLAFVDTVDHAIHTAADLRREMLAIVATARQRRETGNAFREALHQPSGAPPSALDLELADAIAFLDSAGARATAQAAQAQQIAGRLVAAVNLLGAEAQDETDP